MCYKKHKIDQALYSITYKGIRINIEYMTTFTSFWERLLFLFGKGRVYVQSETAYSENRVVIKNYIAFLRK